MINDVLKEVLNTLADSVDKDSINLFNSLYLDTDLGDIADPENFYYTILYPHTQFVTGLIRSKVSSDRNVEFILTNSRFIQQNFEYWIVKHDGHGCCADKSRTIIRRLVKFYKDGTQIEWDYNQEYTYHLPKTIFTTHDSIISFYEALLDIRFGNPNKYLSCVMALTMSFAQNQAKNSK